MSAAITAWALLAVMFTVMAMVRVALSAARSAHPEPRATPEARSSELSNVLLVRPVDAPTGGELANLRKVPSGLEQWVMSPDPTVPNHHPSDPRTQNRKLGHLKAAQVDPARTVLVVDADVEVDDALVDALLSALEGGADLAWAAPHPERRGLVRGLLVQSLHSFVVLDAVTFGARPVCGKAMALSPRAREVLDALPDCIGEDLELARALSAKGLTVKQAGRARMPYGGASVPQVLARFTRWMQVLKAHRPSLFPTIPLLFCCTPVLFVTAHLSGDGMARAAVAALVSLRLILASVLERRPGLYVSWLFAEVLLLACWVRAVLAGSRVKWRGRELVVGAHGVLDPEQRS